MNSPNPTVRTSRVRTALLNAGEDILSEMPVDALSIDEIVQMAGVSKGSFFNHFSSKTEYGDEVVERIRAEVETSVAAKNQGIEDPAVRVAAGICQFIAYGLAEPKKAAILSRGYSAVTMREHPLNRGIKADLIQGETSGRFNFANGDWTDALLTVVGTCAALLVDTLDKRRSKRAVLKRTISTLTIMLRGLGLSTKEAHTAACSAVETI